MATIEQMDTTGPALPAGLTTRKLAIRALQVAAVLVVVAALVSTLPGLGELRDRFGGAVPGWVALAFVFEVGSVLAFVAAFRSTFCTRMPWRFSYQVGMSAQGTNVLLPTGGAGGLALGAWALQRGGMHPSRIARRTVAFFVLTSSVNFGVAIIAGPLVALGVLPGDANLALLLVPAALAAVTVAVMLGLPRVLGRRPQARAETEPQKEPHPGRIRRAAAAVTGALAGGIEDAIALVRSRHFGVIAGAIGYMFFDLFALAAAFKAFGEAPPIGTFAAAYVIGQLGGLIPLPGGLGGTDGGLVASFALFGTSATTAAAAVLAYRAFQLGLPALLGIAAFRGLQRTLARSGAPAGGCEPADTMPLGTAIEVVAIPALPDRN